MEAKRKTIKRILAGTDFSRPASNAVLRAVLLAAEHSAKLNIVHVAPHVDRTWLKHLDLGDLAGCDSDALCKEHLAKAQDLAYAHGVVATVKLLKGSAPLMLANEARRLSADLVVIGHRGEHSLRDALIGTTAERVIERWTGDTLVVKNAPKENYGTILACVALAPVSSSVVMSAVALSDHARLLVLHAYEPLFEMKLISNRASGETLAKHRVAAKQEAVQGLTKLLECCPVPNGRHIERHIRYGGFGGPSALIPGAAVHYGADVIVVGKNQSVIEEFFLGSITKKVIRAARRDIVVSDSR
jgi:nucleotide-binding universal stress UspA family protein